MFYSLLKIMVENVVESEPSSVVLKLPKVEAFIEMKPSIEDSVELKHYGVSILLGNEIDTAPFFHQR